MTMDDLRERLLRAFDAERFREQGHELVDLLAGHLAAALRGEMPVLPWVEPRAGLARWPASFPEEPVGQLGDLLRRVVDSSNHLHHPRYVGHQVSSPLPLAALCDLASSLLNNAMTVYEMGPVSTAMERNLLAWLAARLGLPAGADGVLTSGGSIGNLTALLAARQERASFDLRRRGATGGPPLALLATETVHYSVARAAQIMGLGADGVVPVPVDDRMRMRADELPGALAEADRRGRRAIAVVASAGATATGAFDPLEPIADFSARHALWLHVDGAHGGAAALSERYRPLVAGIERADSVVLDPHKMLLMPGLVTAVLFRDGRHSFAPFSQDASYLFSSPGDAEWFDVGMRTIECSKEMMSLKLYAALSLLGTRLFGDYVTATFDLARRFGTALSSSGDFEVPVPPECNIVCFRHVPRDAPVAGLDALQEQARREVVRSGSFYLGQTRLRGAVYLRTTIINPFTTDADLAALLDEIRAGAQRHR